jgi:hypothetical protein
LSCTGWVQYKTTFPAQCHITFITYFDAQKSKCEWIVEWMIESKIPWKTTSIDLSRNSISMICSVNAFRTKHSSMSTCTCFLPFLFEWNCYSSFDQNFISGRNEDIIPDGFEPVVFTTKENYFSICPDSWCRGKAILENFPNNNPASMKASRILNVDQE